MNLLNTFDQLFGKKSDIKDITILDVINEYQITADYVVNIFKQKYRVENILEGWHQKVYKQKGSLKEFGIKSYAFHGIGIEVTFTDKVIDFDLAATPESRHDGFDLWRLTIFVEGQPKKFAKYLQKDILKKDFESLISHGIIKRPDLKYYSNLYFYSSSLSNLLQ